MPSKRENLEQLLDKNLSKTPDQAQRESQSISSILQRFGGPVRDPQNPLSSPEIEDKPLTAESTVPIIGTPNITIPDLDIPTISTPDTGIPEAGIPVSGTPVITTPKITTSGNRGKKTARSASILVDIVRGWLALPNDVIDKVLPTLSLPEQAVLLRMYRLSRGYGSEVCTIGYVTLGKLCNISRNTVKSAVKSLISAGWIECLEQGVGADHSTYKINLPPATVVKSGTPKTGRLKSTTPNPGMPDVGMATDEGSESITGIPAIAGIPVDGPIKEIKSSKEITHTTQAVSVGSRFNLEECRRYAEHLKQTGQGITNPGGYATMIFRSGEADTLIEQFLKPQLDITKCPDCSGTGHVYIDPNDLDRGVKRCAHTPLLE